MKKIFLNLVGDFKFDFFIMFKSIMGLREYQQEYQTEYYKNNIEDIAEKNRIYYEINKKEKMIKGKKEKAPKNEIINCKLIKVEKRFITLNFD